MLLKIRSLKGLNTMLRIKNIEDKIPDISSLATKTILITKINEVKLKYQGINGLATASALTAVKNKIPNVTNLVKKVTITQKFMKLQ